ncbi:OLC1v1032972C1 [Oldenlandia corymbosa var. corymbosa]|uniref:OLC1v1032972C1 n=1 Tax=Oldenlandia corymbosa var. corymbosa TaxID=529605 RepID=A0AAV1CMD2_OLDCO|nr:OLC1v1032972C1 [Oldenlandia corymbosa var. corymbosa]
MELSKRRRNLGDASGAPTSILDIPFCIMVDIFSRLPVTILLACKFACKAWYSYISNPEFGKLYFKNPPFLSVVMFSINYDYSLVDLKADDHDNNTLNPNALRILQTNEPTGNETVLGSCNGLLCILHHSSCFGGYKLYIWNPLTGERAFLPPPNVEENVKADAFLFGFCEKTNEYKVLRILTRKWKRGKTEVKICTIGSDDSWRVLKQNLPLPRGRKWTDTIFFDDTQFSEVTFKGSLHWITEDSFNWDDVVFAFDVGEEKLKPFPQPNGLYLRYNYTSLAVFRECLSIFQISSSSQVDIWLMKEYGELGSWTKEITVNCSHLPAVLPQLYYPIVFWRGNELLLCGGYGVLYSCDTETMMATKVRATVDRNVRGYAIPFVPCFLSFKDFIKGFDGEPKVLKEK